jgi:signal transduction histidine kinase
MQDERDLYVLDLSTVVHSEVDKIRDRHPDATIETRLPESVFVQGDELLGRIFGNLLSNAIEHNDPDSVRVVIEAETDRGDVVVTIRDDGSGIPQDELDTLFDRPYQGDHGLGLYLVTELAESYGGTVELVGTGEDGTTFAVTLPRTERRRADSPPIA